MRRVSIVVIAVIGLALLAAAPSTIGSVLRLGAVATSSLPSASVNNAGGLIFDTTTQTVKYSDGGTWTEISGVGTSSSDVSVFARSDGGTIGIGSAITLWAANGIEVKDSAAAFLTDTFTAPTTALYRVSACVAVDWTIQAACPTLTTQPKRMTLYAKVNGTIRTFMYDNTSQRCDIEDICGTADIDVTVGDTVTVELGNGSGVALPLGTNVRDNWLSITRAGP